MKKTLWRIYGSDDDTASDNSEQDNPTKKVCTTSEDHHYDECIRMSISDIESMCLNRQYYCNGRVRDLCKMFLSSFHCDICLNVIASCRTVVPCGHNYW